MTLTLSIFLASAFLPSHGPEEDPAGKDLNKLQGTWVIEAITQEGKDTPETLREIKRYTIKGDQWRVSFKGAEKPLFELRIKMDPRSKPKTIDYIGQKTDTVIMRAIYELEGDTLKVCFPVGAGDRPKEFKSEAGSKSGIILYKRVKE